MTEGQEEALWEQMFVTSIVVTASRVCMYVKTYKEHTLNMCSVSCINYSLIKVF